MQPKVDDVPQSFLHRLVSTTSVTKVEEEEKPMLEDKKETYKESFLYKNSDRKLGEAGSFDSFEFVTVESLVESTPKLKSDYGKSEGNGGKDQIIFTGINQ